MENYKIDRQVLTLKDMVSIISALKGINVALEDKELDTAINKISSLIPKDKTEHLEINSGHIVFDILPWGQRKSRKDMLKKINECIVNCRLISIEYLNTKAEESKRIIEPMTLLFKGYSWYLFAYCSLKNDYRMFRISRIKSLEVLDKEFTALRILLKSLEQGESCLIHDLVGLLNYPLSLEHFNLDN